MLIGSGWLDDEKSPALSGQSLAIRVSANRSDVGTVIEKVSDSVESVSTTQAPRNSEASVIKPLKSQRPPSKVSASEVSVPVAMQKVAAAQTLNETKVTKEPRANTEVSPSLESQAKESVEVLSAAVQQETFSAEAIRVAPLYQSNPAFRAPPQPPNYPRLARKRGIEGQVVLRVDIGPAGDVLALIIEQSSGSGLLDKAARKAVHQWQFVPAQANGIAVASYVRIPVDFVLEAH